MFDLKLEKLIYEFQCKIVHLDAYNDKKKFIAFV